MAHDAHQHRQSHADAAHSHAAEPDSQRARRRLTRALMLIGGFAAVELVGGWLTHSLALLADAGHMLTDVLSLSLALAAIGASGQSADSRRTYGYWRYEVLAAFTNGLFLALISVWILFEAVTRLWQPVAVAGGALLAIAAAGLVVNCLAYFVLHGAHADLNVRAAAAHVVGDLLGSVAALVAGILILAFGWTWADPALSALVATVLMVMGVRLIREAGHVLLEGSPAHLDFTRLRGELVAAVPSLLSVHHVHAWSLTPQQPMMTLHAVVPEPADGDQVIREIGAFLKSHHGVQHVTVQIERQSCDQDCADR
jgi:cobalt-zinc-cadmium efflux system protein